MEGLGMGEEELGVGWQFVRAWWALVHEALESVEPVEDVIVKVRWRGDGIFFVTSRVRIVGREYGEGCDGGVGYGLGRWDGCHGDGAFGKIPSDVGAASRSMVGSGTSGKEKVGNGSGVGVQGFA
jgi:hypothetical protein